MPELRNKPVLVTRVQFRWYTVALVPIVLLGWLTLAGLVPPIFAPIALFASVFWLSSLVFALVAKLRRPRPELRQ